MIDFLARSYPGDAVALGAAVVMLQITAVIALAAGAARWLARGAAARHAVWLAALWCVLICPIVAAVAGRLGLTLLKIELPGGPPAVEARQDGAWAESETIPALAAPHVSTAAPRPEGETPVPPVVRDTPPAAPSGEATPPALVRSGVGIAASTDAPHHADVWRAVLGALFLAWAAGAVFLLLRLLYGRRVLARWRRAAWPADARRLAGVLDAVRSMLRVRDLPPILLSPCAAGPSAVGVLRPCVLLPDGLIDSLDDGQLRDVLIHECAHLLRRDPLVGLLQRLAEAFFWPHPLLHYLNRRLARAREEVCDDYVLRAGDARAYARTLLTLAESGVRLPVGAPGLFGSNWKLEDRVAGLLDPRRTPMTRVKPWTVAAVAALLLAACLAAAAVRPAKAAGEKAAGNKDKSEPAGDVSKAVIEGVVVDADGKPVAGATVGLNIPFPESITDRTAADGSFRLVLDTAAVGNAVVVKASANDGERQGIYAFDSMSVSRTAHARVVLKPSRKMTVRVIDGAKKPVEGAAVGVRDYDSSTLLAHAETDAHGTVSLRLPSDARVEQVFALKPQVGFDYFENYRSWPWVIIGEPPARVNLTLDGARTLSVRAVDSADKPLPGVELAPWTVQKRGKLADVNLSGLAAMKYVSSRTGADGLAVFEWLPTDMEGGVTIRYDGTEYYLSGQAYQGTILPYQTLTAKLLPMTPIGGKVTLPDGKPAAGVLLQAEGSGDSGSYCRGVARTKADGSYSMLVYPNHTYIIAVTDESWAAPSNTGVFVGEDAPREHLDFRLAKGTVIHGRVTVGPDDKPAAKQSVTLIEQWSDGVVAPNQGKTVELVRWAETGADGRYEFRVGPGLYRINAGTQLDREGLIVKEEETITKDFHLDRPDDDLDAKLLKGVVLAETVDGKPVGGAILRGEPARFDGHTGFAAVADEKGRFELQRRAVKMSVYARNPEGTLSALVSIGEDDEEAKVVLSIAGKLKGRVIDKAGKPVAGVRILCGLRIGPEEKPFSRTDVYTQTDDAGRFIVAGVIPGAQCRVSAFDSSRKSSTVKEVPSAPAESLDLGDLVFDLTP